MPRPDVTYVNSVAAHPDPVLRNLLITHGYHELALALRAHTGSGANWCTFATWASRQAGQTIRREDLREALRARLAVSQQALGLAAAALAAARTEPAVNAAAGLVEYVVQALDAEGAFERASAAAAAGNRKVFAEIAAEVARFLDALESADPDAVPRFIASLRTGEPPEGQRWLREAFAAYRDAIATRNPQLLFYGNVLIAVHEQTRLQPEILTLMNAAFDADVVRRRIIDRLLPRHWRALRYRVAGWFGRRPPLDDIVDRLIAAVQRELRALITDNVLTLRFPGRTTVRLGRDVAGTHAPSLARIEDARIDAMLRRFDPRPDSVAGSGARDWGVLEQRLHLITDLFRCHHETAPLFDPPFTPAQVSTLRAGRRPAPPL